MPRRTAPIVALLCVAALVGCGDEDEPRAADFDFAGDRLAPPVGKGFGIEGSETDADPEESVLELELDSGAVVVLWIGKDKREVFQQHSDPDDEDAWTEPELLFAAGDGCHRILGDSNGETVAATLECYEHDLFIQQAPDQGQAVVTQDLDDWQVHDGGELYGEPVVSDDGDEVIWKEHDLRWTATDGFL
jgi:hypothetical protein